LIAGFYFTADNVYMEKIQSQLIKPFVEKMEKEWQSLYDKVTQSQAPEAEELRPVVEEHLNQIRGLLKKESTLEPSAESESAHDFVRQSKMSLRSAERRWQRHLVSTERVKTRLQNHSAKFPPASSGPETSSQ